jgi:hypothetical protein
VVAPVPCLCALAQQLPARLVVSRLSLVTRTAVLVAMPPAQPAPPQLLERTVATFGWLLAAPLKAPEALCP